MDVDVDFILHPSTRNGLFTSNILSTSTEKLNVLSTQVTETIDSTSVDQNLFKVSTNNIATTTSAGQVMKEIVYVETTQNNRFLNHSMSSEQSLMELTTEQLTMNKLNSILKITTQISSQVEMNDLQNIIESTTTPVNHNFCASGSAQDVMCSKEYVNTSLRTEGNTENTMSNEHTTENLNEYRVTTDRSIDVVSPIITTEKNIDHHLLVLTEYPNKGIEHRDIISTTSEYMLALALTDPPDFSTETNRDIESMVIMVDDGIVDTIADLGVTTTEAGNSVLAFTPSILCKYSALFYVMITLKQYLSIF